MNTQKGKEWEEKMNKSLENVEMPHKQDSLTPHYSLSLLIQTLQRGNKLVTQKGKIKEKHNILITHLFLFIILEL